MSTQRTVPAHRASSPRALDRRRSGFSLVEVLMAGVVIVIAMSGFSRAIVSGLKVNEANRKTAIASEAAQEMLETLYAQNFRNVFAAYNDTTADDPPGLAPGSSFPITRSTWTVESATGMTGTLTFPTMPGAPGVLREDVVDFGLGMPRDLNGDGLVDGLDHSGDYVVLPVRIRVTWPGGGRFTYSALLGGL